MSSARSSSAAGARRSERAAAPPRPAPAPRRVVIPSSVMRVRWERVGRIALLVVLGAVMLLYAEHAVSYLRIHAAASRAKAVVTQLQRENRSLAAQATSLRSPETIVREARGLGMVRRGEQSYAITGETSGN